MKTRILVWFTVPAVIAALVYGYLRTRDEQKADELADQPVGQNSPAQSGAHGELVLTLDPKAQALIGLQTTNLAAATLPPAIRAYGRALDPAPLAALANEKAADRAALDATTAEYERLKNLVQNRNASLKALEDAQAAMKRDQAALASVEARLLAVSGKTVADQEDLPAFIESLVDLKTVLVRLDVPAGEWLAEAPTGALVLSPGGAQAIPAQFLGRASTADPQVQGEGFLCAVSTASARLTPGLAVSGYLQLPGQPLQGVVVPDNAVVRSADRAWTYVQTGDTIFMRREIGLDHPTPAGWFVTRGVAPGDRVVVTGAQMLLSEERQTQIKPED
jgi:hypothetical protein